MNPDFGYMEKQNFDISKEKIEQLIPMNDVSLSKKILELEMDREKNNKEK